MKLYALLVCGSWTNPKLVDAWKQIVSGQIQINNAEKLPSECGRYVHLYFLNVLYSSQLRVELSQRPFMIVFLTFLLTTHALQFNACLDGGQDSPLQTITFNVPSIQQTPILCTAKYTRQRSPLINNCLTWGILFYFQIETNSALKLCIWWLIPQMHFPNDPITKIVPIKKLAWSQPSRMNVKWRKESGQKNTFVKLLHPDWLILVWSRAIGEVCSQLSLYLCIWIGLPTLSLLQISVRVASQE